MPKLRNGGNEIAKFTDWIGRKCRNHNPLHELNMSDSKSLPRMHNKGKGEGNLHVVTMANEPDKGHLLYQVGNRTFQITVSEITERPDLLEIMADSPKVAVGF